MKNFLAVLIFGVFISSSAFAYHDTVTQTGEFDYKEFFVELFDFVNDHHVDEQDGKLLVEEAAKAMFKALDKHSAYFTAEEYKEFANSSENRYYGIGAHVSWDDERHGVLLEQLFDDSPAFRAGLHANDLIVEVNGEKTSDIGNLEKTVKQIVGEEGTDVILTIVRNGKKINHDFLVTRAKVNAPVTHSQVLDDTIAFVRLTQFSGNSYRSVMNAIAETSIKINNENKNVTGVVLDLRFNPGGRLDQAVGIVDLFVNEGLIVETRSRHENDDSEMFATTDMLIPVDIPLVILINKYSASASEVVSGALQALNRATIMGEKSYGKGSVQTVMPLPHGAAIKLTVAKYYTASGKLIDGVGITPDVNMVLPEDYRRAERDEVDPVMDAAAKFIQNLAKN